MEKFREFQRYQESLRVAREQSADKNGNFRIVQVDRFKLDILKRSLSSLALRVRSGLVPSVK